MPANNNQNANQNQSANAPKGDILTQIVAKDTSLKDLYLLEKTMSASLMSIDKIQQKMNTTLSSVDKNILKGNKTLSSIDTSMHQVLTKLDALAQGVLTHSTNRPKLDNLNLKTVESLLTNINQNTADVLTTIANSTAASVVSSTPANMYDTDLADIKDLLDSIDKTTLDVGSVVSNVDQNTFDILTTLSNYVTNISNSQIPTTPANTPNSADIETYLISIDKTTSDMESVLSTIDQTTFDIFTILGNINTNTSRPTTSSAQSSTSTSNSGTTNKLDDALQNQYLHTALNALANQSNIRDAIAAQMRINQPTLGTDDFDEQLNDILKSITVPLSTNVETEKDLRDLLERLNQRVADGWMMQEEANQLSVEAMNNFMTSALQQVESRQAASRVSFVDQLKDKLISVLPDIMKNVGSGQAIASDVVSIGGSAIGSVVSDAIKVALPGLAGSFLGEYAEKVIGGLSKNFSEYIGYLTTSVQNVRNEIIKSGFEKIRKDVNDMATYSIDIYTKSVNDLYSVWDTNLGKVTATQGYTKEALNTLQDAVAQRLQAEGYGNVINAGDYITELANTLNSKLGGELAEAFAAQNLILQKAVPEVDLSTMGETFAAIYRSARLQGADAEEIMVSAMNQIVGATKALEETTSGNNQFISQIDNLLKKANEVVLSSNGTANQVAEMATQLMAAEAPLSAIAPQLSGFTSTLVDKLLSGNDATAVALRAIMNTLDSNIGITETSFRKSLMEDTQGVLSTAFEAIGQFINDNSNESAQYEFYKSMETVFGIASNQLAQIDFSLIAQQIAEASTATNMKALTDAENLVKAGETTTLEEQLVANTSNQLLATNAIADTLDNALMRKLEQNELALERQIAVLQSEQVVNLAEKTMNMLTGVADVVRHALDPLGLTDGLLELLDDGFAAVMDAQRYMTTTTASSIESAVADRSAADQQTWANTVGNALAIGATQLTSLGMPSALDYANDIKNYGVVNTFNEMMSAYKQTADTATQTTVDITNSVQATAVTQANLADTLVRTEEQIKASQAYQEKIATANQTNTAFEQKRAEAAQQQRALLEAERAMTTANHDNIEAIRESVSKLDELSNYLSPILDENRNQSGLLQTLSEKFDQLMHTLVNRTAQPTTTSPTPNVNTSYNERDRIYGPVKVW